MDHRSIRTIDDIIKREGTEFTNDPDDRGGATKFGITQRSWDAYRRRRHEFERNALPENVRDLDIGMARTFYFIVHVKPWNWIEDDWLHELLIDCAVNHGPSRAARWVQTAAGAVPDGIIGPKTKAAVNPAGHSDTVKTKRIYNEVLRTRIRFYGKIATDQRDKPGGDPDAKFLGGWLNRAVSFIR